MNPQASSDRLSHISTLWTLLRQAHSRSGEELNAAQEQLIQRYSAAIHAYLMGALHDPAAADDLFQEFWLRFLKGYFRHADPVRGRFRDLVRTALSNLINDHRRRHQRQPHALPEAAEHLLADSTEPSMPEADLAFLDNWRQDLLDHAWRELARAQEQSVQPLHAVLLCRSNHPDLSSEEMAAKLSRELGKPLTADGVRQVLRRARDRFADLLLHAVADSLKHPTLTDLEEEVTALGLLPYCRRALERRRHQA